jgi:hypothetical protein
MYSIARLAMLTRDILHAPRHTKFREWVPLPDVVVAAAAVVVTAAAAAARYTSSKLVLA